MGNEGKAAVVGGKGRLEWNMDGDYWVECADGRERRWGILGLATKHWGSPRGSKRVRDAWTSGYTCLFLFAHMYVPCVCSCKEAGLASC